MTPEQQAALTHSPVPAPIPTAIAGFQSDPAFADPLKLAPVPAPELGAPSGVPPIGVPVAPSPAPVPAAVDPAAAPAAVGPAPAIPVVPQGGAARPAAAPAPAQPSALENSATAVSAAEAKQLELAKTANEDEADSLELQAETKRKQAEDLAVKQRIQQMDREESDARIDSAFKTFKETKRTSFFKDKSVLQDIAMGLGAILGSVSFSEQHTNQAINIIDKAIHRHMETQEAERADLWRGVQMAQEQGKSLSQQQIQEISELRLQQALSLEAVIDQGKAMASRSKNKAGIAALEANNARYALERDKMLSDVHRLDSAAAETARHNRATESISREHVRATAAAGAGTKEDAFLNRMTMDIQRGIKMEPGQLTAKRLASKAELQEVLSELDSGNPLRYGAALDKFTKSATGLGARPGSVKLFEDRLGSKLDHIKAMIGGAVNGQPMSENQLKRFKEAAQGEMSAVDESLKTLRSAREKGLKSHPVYGKHPDIINSVLGTVYGDSEGAAQLPAGWKDTGKTIGGKPAYQSPDGKIHVAQ